MSFVCVDFLCANLIGGGCRAGEGDRAGAREGARPGTRKGDRAGARKGERAVTRMTDKTRDCTHR